MAKDNSRLLNTANLVEIISPKGRLNQFLKNYESRAQQEAMLADVAEAYNKEKIALIEAGTGTGKSLAYLIPAIAWSYKTKERAVISTNTISLQEQLITKDIPLLEKIIGFEFKAVLIKGMRNYLCLRKLEDAQQEALLLSPEERKEIQMIASWSEKTIEGSRSDLKFVPRGTIWDRVNAESDTCNNNECPYYNKCFFFKARREAANANLLIVNHHLLFADLARRLEDENYSDTAVLPAYHSIIIDEAHHIEDIATEFFALHTSRLEILHTLGRIAAEKTGGKLAFLKNKLSEHHLKHPSQKMVLFMSKLNADLPGIRREFVTHLMELFETYSSLFPQKSENEGDKDLADGDKVRMMKEHYSQQFWKESVIKKMKQTVDFARRYILAINALIKEMEDLKDEKLNEMTQGVRTDIIAYSNRLEEHCSILELFTEGSCGSNQVRWMEKQQIQNHPNIHLTDAQLDISQQLVDALFDKFSTVILCSATMTTNKSFEFIRNRLGITIQKLPGKKVIEKVYEAPFNYNEQALLAVYNDIPNPSDPLFIRAAAERIWFSIQASLGNAFILFTSYSMLKACYELLYDHLEKNNYKVFKQGDEQRRTLLDKFKVTNRSVLFGTDSFWEGVDVAGDALRCVIIVKLPFKVPTEPIIQARTEAIAASGGDPFYEYTIPQAIVKFKQGFGRLIRNKNDRGCIVCLDSRIATKNYGKLFLNSLPPCQYVVGNAQQIYAEMAAFYQRTEFLAKR
jgi:ATP-dependent DNA helicase DinG